MENLIALLVAAPLLGAVVLLCGGRRLDRVGHWIGTLLAAVSFVLGVVLFADLLGSGAEDRTLTQHLFSWIPVEGFQADVAFRLDQLSMTFVLLITGVGSLIHLYSVAYMEHDERRRRFFGYLNLFLAAMLILVLADNYLLLYVGWEGVGLASYLLIGFWQHKPSAATAAKKAFLVNRVGDMGLSIGIMLMFLWFGTFAFGPVLGGHGEAGLAAEADEGKLTAIALMLLLAACGKSAQVPLQSWLGDAMEGPTPVSARIHAATMVTAGVYLIVRSAPSSNARRTRSWSSPSSARSRCCSVRSSVVPRTTSRRRWPVRPCRRSATWCSPRASARSATSSRSCTLVAAPPASSRPGCSSAPAPSCTA
ncbi:NAD(P)H-quinone oxidoreductase subunit 2, chloroplastic [Streptomyces tendae]